MAYLLNDYCINKIISVYTKFVYRVYKIILVYTEFQYSGGCRDRMVVGFITTYTTQ